MKIQTRILLLIGVIIVLFSGWLALQMREEGKKLSAISDETVREKKVSFARSMELKGTNLKGLANDYSYWDEMVGFIKNKDASWAYPNFKSGLATFKADGMWVLDPGFGEVYSLFSKKAGSLGTGLDKNNYKTAFDRGLFPHFFVMTKAGLLEFRGAPVQPVSDVERKSKPSGYLLAGKLWTNADVDELASLTGCSIEIKGMTGPEPARIIKNGEVRFTEDLAGWDGRPSVDVYLNTIPGSYNDITKAMKRQMTFFVIFAAAILCIMSFAMIKWVSRPLARISRTLAEQNPTLLAGMEDDQTEFGMTAGLIKRFFEQKAELEYRNIVLATQQHVSPDGVLVVDEDNTVTSCNRRFSEIWGVSDGLIKPGMYEPALYSAASSTSGQEKLNSCLKCMDGRRDFAGRDEYALKGGTVVDVYTTPMLGPDGKYYGRVWYCRDITHRKKTEAALQQEKNKLETILNNITDGVSIQDAGFRVLYQNHSVVEMYGAHTGEHCYSAYEDRQEVCDGCPVAASFKDGAVHTAETTMTVGGRTVHAEIKSAPLRDMYGRVVASIESIRDITDRKRSEEEIKRLNEELDVKRMRKAG